MITVSKVGPWYGDRETDIVSIKAHRGGIQDLIHGDPIPYGSYRWLACMVGRIAVVVFVLQWIIYYRRPLHIGRSRTGPGALARFNGISTSLKKSPTGERKIRGGQNRQRRVKKRRCSPGKVCILAAEVNLQIRRHLCRQG